MSACVTPLTPRVEPFRISDIVTEGDATRRASSRLLLRALEADVARDSHRARSLFQRALQVDSTNPYAFLTLARFEAQHGSVEQGLSYLGQADALLMLEEAPGGALIHAQGLRGSLLRRAGDAGSEPLLGAAAAALPDAWADGQLDASELR